MKPISARSVAGVCFAVLFLSVIPPSAPAAEKTIVKILTGPVQQIAGPRRSIYVDQISASGPISNDPSGWDVSGGLSAMLTTALTESQRFIVVDRSTIGVLQGEHDLAKSLAENGQIVAASGHVIPAQYAVSGMVTEFGVSSGTSAGVAGIGGVLDNALSMSHASGKIAIDFKVTSARTMAVIGTFVVSKSISNSSVGFTGSYKGMSFGDTTFWNTPLGEATREAMNEAVNKIVQIVSGGHWEAQIADIDGDTVYINAGGIAGLKVGDKLAVEHVTKTIMDPSTAEVLGELKSRVAVIDITSVEDKFSTGRFEAPPTAAVQRGDIVVSGE
jgi:curli biogenesis system outer membrane secretion channel CsgG